MLDLRDLRVVVGIPPQDAFGGHSIERTGSLTDVFRTLGLTVRTVLAEDWQKPSERARIASELTKFDPHFAIAIPTTGVALYFFQDEAGKNLFSDILNVPLVLPWDHLLIHAPMYYLGDRMYQHPQRAGALDEIRQGLRHPRSRHYVADSAYVEIYEGLGLLGPGPTQRYHFGADNNFLRAGVASSNPGLRGRIGFAGNIYTALGSKLQLLQHQIIRELDAALSAAKCRRWDVSSFQLLSELLAQLPQDFREANGLTPDFPLYWWVVRELITKRASTAYRLSVLETIEEPIDFFGNFVDPESTSTLSAYPRIRFGGNLAYPMELAEAFRSREIWVDVTNGPSIHSCSDKIWNCFAAGGFMLIDYSVDLRADVGDLAEQFMYRSPGELKAKIRRYLDHPKERYEITAAMQAMIRERFTWRHFYERVCADIIAELRAGTRTPQELVPSK